MCDELDCLRDPKHQHSKHTTSAYLKKTNQRMDVIEHISDLWSK